MEPFFIHLLESSGILSLFLGCYYLFLRKETFFNGNRWFLLFGLLAALSVPFISITKTVFVDPAPMVSVPINFASTVEPLPESVMSRSEVTWMLLILWAYSVGIAVLAIRFLVQLFHLKRTTKNADTITKKDGLVFVETPKATSPFSFFNYIFYSPDAFEINELKTILAHEEVHARQWHSVDIVFSELMVIFFWWNPLIWLYKRSIGQNLEFLADAEASELHESKKKYQYLMLKQITDLPNGLITNSFYNSFIKTRITMLNIQKSNRKSIYKYGLIIPMLTAFMLFFNVETVAKVRPNAFQEESTAVLNKKVEPKLYTVTKNTSTKELESMTKEIQEEGGKLRIEEIKRNTEGIITSIKIIYTSGSGTAMDNADNTNGIHPIYFGRTINGGSFIGIDKEAMPYLMNGKPYFKPLKEGEERNNSFTRTNAEGSVTTYVKRVMKNGKEILYVNGKESTEAELNKLGIYSDRPIQKKAEIVKYFKQDASYEFIMTKNDTDTQLKTLKQKIEGRFGGTFSYSKLKRNEKGEIINLNIEYSSDTGGGASSQLDKGEPIPNILFKENEKKGLNITILQVFSKENSNQSIRAESGDVSLDIFYPLDSIVAKQNNRDINASETGNFNVSSIENPSHFSNVRIRGTSTLKDSTPLIYLDGREISLLKLNEIHPDDIHSISVLKDEKATSAYGEKGKDGVILITSKSKSISNLKIGYPLNDEKSNENDFSHIITKHTSNKELRRLVSKMKKNQLEFVYNDVLRNKNGEIIQIEISIKDKTGLKTAGSARWTNEDKTIPNILVGRINGTIRATSSL